MVWLDNVSFAFYLIQFPVMVLITRNLLGGKEFGIVGWAGFAVLSLIVSTAIAAVLYHWVDLPIMRCFARVKRTTEPQPTPA